MLTIEADNRLTIRIKSSIVSLLLFKTALCSYYPLLTKPALFRKDTVIVQLRCRYRSAKVSILLVLHGRDEIFPRLW